MILPDDDIIHERNLGKRQDDRRFVSITQFFNQQQRFSRVEHMFKKDEKKFEIQLARSSTCALIHS